MTPPSRTICAARRIRRCWGFCGCSSKYSLKRWRQRLKSSDLSGFRPAPWRSRPARDKIRGLFRRESTPRDTHKVMQSLLEFAPLVAFFVAYKLADLYTATGVLMVAMLVLLAVDYLRERRIPPMHGLSAVLVFAFGALTLLLHNQHFIQWKPTVFFWLAGLAFLGSFWVGKRTLTERMLGAALGDHVRVPERLWRYLNGVWVVFYALLGGLNLLVAYYATERVWVTFKVIGLPLLTLVFVAGQVMWLTRRSDEAQAQPSA